MKMSLTEFAAFFGAIASLVAIIWNIIRALRDKPKLKIDARIEKQFRTDAVFDKFPNKRYRDYLIITVTNIGRRPLVVKSWGWMKKKGKEGNRRITFGALHLPRMLNEGEYHTETTAPLSTLSSDIENIFVQDSVGREWEAKRKNLKRLLEDIKKVKSADKE